MAMSKVRISSPHEDCAWWRRRALFSLRVPRLWRQIRLLHVGAFFHPSGLARLGKHVASVLHGVIRIRSVRDDANSFLDPLANALRQIVPHTAAVAALVIIAGEAEVGIALTPCGPHPCRKFLSGPFLSLTFCQALQSFNKDR